MDKDKTVKTKEHNNYEISFRVIQSVFVGIFALGLSSGIGDYCQYLKLPFSTFSITSFVFGIIGIIATEIISRVAKKW
jgi:hypothetical protein